MIPVHFSSWLLECRHSLLPSPVWPLPICLDSWTWHSRRLCNIALYSIRPCFYHQSHPQLGIVYYFGSIPSFFLELFLHWSPVAYWAPTDLGSYSFSILSLCLFILFMEFSRQEYWSGLPFPSPGDLPNPRVEPRSPAQVADSYCLRHQGSPELNWY